MKVKRKQYYANSRGRRDVMTKEGSLSILEITGLGLLVLMVVCMIFLPFSRARRTSQQNACIGNLRQIESAKEQWAMAMQRDNGEPVVTAAVNQYIKGSMTPTCPGGGYYIYNAIGTVADCSVQNPDHSY